MTQPDELKPCPLPACGGIAKRHRVSNPVLDNYYDHSIKCSKCGLQTAYVPIRVDNPVPPQMYDRWNTRSTPDQQAIDDVKLLRKAYGELKVVTCSHEDHRGLVVRPPQDVYNGLSIMHALAATEADAEAWLKERDAKWLSNQETAVQLWSTAEQQLATVTAERDALREFVDFVAVHKNDAYCSRDLSNMGFDAFCLLERLTQSPPSE